jgi:type II secretory pathway pseudopilin PulG
MASRDRRRTRGATLLEVLTATGVMVSVLAIGVPQLNRMRGPYVLSSATRRIAADLQVARQRAIARNARYRVSFDADSYLLEWESAPSSFVADGGLQELPSGATVGTPTPANPVFDSRGMLTGDVTVPVSVAGVGTRTVTINVLGRTTIN